MSFDVFFGGFAHGQPVGGGELVRAALDPYIVGEETEHGYLEIGVGDGRADIYLGAESMMANHVSGSEPWDVLVRAARAADWVIMPTGCPTALLHKDQRKHLPEELRAQAVLVSDGDDLLNLIRSQ